MAVQSTNSHLSVPLAAHQEITREARADDGCKTLLKVAVIAIATFAILASFATLPLVPALLFSAVILAVSAIIVDSSGGGNVVVVEDSSRPNIVIIPSSPRPQLPPVRGHWVSSWFSPTPVPRHVRVLPAPIAIPARHNTPSPLVPSRGGYSSAPVRSHPGAGHVTPVRTPQPFRAVHVQPGAGHGHALAPVHQHPPGRAHVQPGIGHSR